MSSSTPGAVLYYTVDSTTPTTRSPKDNPTLGVIVTQTRTVVKALA
ncbi:MAG: chitobiase/beta-hexosaminidase C-terminal domain-containing protein, partial [bacterium]